MLSWGWGEGNILFLFCVSLTIYSHFGRICVKCNLEQCNMLTLLNRLWGYFLHS